MTDGDHELPPYPLDVDRLLGTIASHGVEYVLVGGSALVIYGAIDRVTFDVDVVPARSRANLERLATALNELGARVISAWDPTTGELVVERAALTPDVFEANPFLHLLTDAGRVDVMLAPDGVPGGFDELAPNTNEATVGGTPILIAALDDLVAMKRVVDRAKDREDLDHIARQRGLADDPDAPAEG